jgi:hypothetical protein
LIPKNRFKNGLKNAGERTNTIFISFSPLWISKYRALTALAKQKHACGDHHQGLKKGKNVSR